MDPRKKRYTSNNGGDKPVSDAVPRSQRSYFTIFALLLVAAFGIIAYINSVSGKFIYDDIRLVCDNSYIRKFANMILIFTKDIGSGAGSSIYQYNFYRPLQTLTYTADFFLWGLDPAGYHITNIVLHILVAFALYVFINILFKNRTLSLVATLLYIVHPLHTEAVSYISGRADMLVGFFILSFFILYIRSLEKNRGMCIFLASVCYFCALLSKESAVIVPLAVPAYFYVFRKKINWTYWLIIGVTALYFIIRTTIYQSGASAHITTTFIQRLPGFFVALAMYARLLVAPFGLHMEYGSGIFSFMNGMAIAGFVIFISLIALAYYARKKDDKLLLFSILWFFIALAPQSNLYPVNAYMAEHWLYIASIGFFLVLADALVKLYDNIKFKQIALALIVLITSYYLILTIRQNNYWSNSEVFYSQTLKQGGQSVRIYSNLGNEYMSKGEFEKAIELYKKAIETGSDLAGAYNNIGLAYSELQKKEEAITAFKKAIELNPSFAEAYNNLGIMYDAVGNSEEAVRMYSKAVEINPRYAEAYNNLGTDTYDSEKAIELYKKAIDIKPDYAEAYYNMAKALELLGEYAKSQEMYKKAKSINPKLP